MWAQMKKSTLAGCNGRGAEPPHQISLKSITNVSPSFLGMCSVYSFQFYQNRSIWNCKPAMIKNHTSFIHVNSLRRKFKRVQLLTLKLQFSFQLLEIAIPEQLEASFQWKTFPLGRRPNPHFNRHIVLSGWGTLLQIVTRTSYTFLQLMLSPGKEIFAKIHQNVHCWHLQIGESADASNLQL